MGCGDGSVAAEIMRHRPSLTFRGLEVTPRPVTAIPVDRFDGKRIPRGDASVDAVLLVDVLHHADHPHALLEECVRVARTVVLVKDHLKEGFLAHSTLRLMDWAGNAPHGVVRPNTYWSRREWDSAWQDLGIEPTAWRERLNLYPPPLSWAFDRSLHFVARLERSR